ncbi:uncharacterized protein CC84DRAFT_1203950 [Paraphaeosphaeria sporulosa]|uniref:Uncharacterized protein n=1 Tax=Paraphaeosphaeria sporulosa TaxID=1460663 RepID=A0A177CNX5_9PLEO|nr:uncharacterized protein CC84DRAFT_1203950 [Paraphaeosphaeria sporulosa]OAG08618.1 hypothetical protein CC84DRAFT_1203950 [Paraphaeosphaeria sporulosa]
MEVQPSSTRPNGGAVASRAFSRYSAVFSFIRPRFKKTMTDVQISVSKYTKPPCRYPRRAPEPSPLSPDTGTATVPDNTPIMREVEVCGDSCHDVSRFCLFARSALSSDIVSTLLCVRYQTLLLAHFKIISQHEGLPVDVLFSACFHARLRGHEEIAAYTLSDVFVTVVVLGQSVLECTSQA